MLQMITLSDILIIRLLQKMYFINYFINNNDNNLMPSTSLLSLGLAERITMLFPWPGLTPCIKQKQVL